MSKDFPRTPECILYACCGSKCKERGGKHLFKQLKRSVKEKHLKGTVQVIKTGCTDHCKKGPVIVVMPKNEWHFNMNEEKAIALHEQLR